MITLVICVGVGLFVLTLLFAQALGHAAEVGDQAFEQRAPETGLVRSVAEDDPLLIEAIRLRELFSGRGPLATSARHAAG